MKESYVNTAMSIVLQNISTRTRILTTVLAIGIGVFFPRIFHLLGVGHIFLPMFVPIVLIAPILSIPFILLYVGCYSVPLHAYFRYAHVGRFHL